MPLHFRLDCIPGLDCLIIWISEIIKLSKPGMQSKPDVELRT